MLTYDTEADANQTRDLFARTERRRFARLAQGDKG